MEKALKNSIHRDLFKTKTSKQKTPRLQAAFYVSYSVWIGQKRHLPKMFR